MYQAEPVKNLQNKRKLLVYPELVWHLQYMFMHAVFSLSDRKV